MADILDFNSKTRAAPEHTPMEFEFHLFKSLIVEDGQLQGEDIVQKATGYLRFGPQFVAVVDSYGPEAETIFAAQTPLVRFVKRIGTDGQVEATLSPGG